MAKTLTGTIDLKMTDDNSTESGNVSLSPAALSPSITVTNGTAWNLTVSAAATVDLFASAPTGTVLVNGWIKYADAEPLATQTCDLNQDAGGTEAKHILFSAKPSASLTLTNNGANAIEVYCIAVT